MYMLSLGLLNLLNLKLFINNSEPLWIETKYTTAFQFEVKNTNAHETQILLLFVFLFFYLFYY